MCEPTPRNPNFIRDSLLCVVGLYASLYVAGLTAPHWKPTVLKLLQSPSVGTPTVPTSIKN